jgi:hypothetical protein
VTTPPRACAREGGCIALEPRRAPRTMPANTWIRSARERADRLSFIVSSPARALTHRAGDALATSAVKAHRRCDPIQNRGGASAAVVHVRRSATPRSVRRSVKALSTARPWPRGTAKGSRRCGLTESSAVASIASEDQACSCRRNAASVPAARIDETCAARPCGRASERTYNLRGRCGHACSAVTPDAMEAPDMSGVLRALPPSDARVGDAESVGARREDQSVVDPSLRDVPPNQRQPVLPADSAVGSRRHGAQGRGRDDFALKRC